MAIYICSKRQEANLGGSVWLLKEGRKKDWGYLVGCFKLARRSFLVQEISNGQTTHNRREGGVGVKTFRALTNQRLESKHMLHVHAIEELVSMVLRPTKHVDFKNQSRFIYDFIHH